MMRAAGLKDIKACWLKGRLEINAHLSRGGVLLAQKAIFLDFSK